MKLNALTKLYLRRNCSHGPSNACQVAVEPSRGGNAEERGTLAGTAQHSVRREVVQGSRRGGLQRSNQKGARVLKCGEAETGGWEAYVAPAVPVL